MADIRVDDIVEARVSPNRMGRARVIGVGTKTVHGDQRVILAVLGEEPQRYMSADVNEVTPTGERFPGARP